jgi:hypothetical protein
MVRSASGLVLALLIGVTALAAPCAAQTVATSGSKRATVEAVTAGTPELAPKLELEGPEVEAKEQARGLFQRGVEAYRNGRYYEAVELFLETQRVYPDNQLCFNVARAYENLGNTSAALSYYREYLRRADRPSDGEQVLERIRKLEQLLAARGVQQLTVLSTPEGATLLIDGRPVGITPWTGETYPGKHRLALELSGHDGVSEVIEVAAHAARDFTFSLKASQREPLQTPTSPRPAREDLSAAGVRVPTLVTLGVGALLLGSALAVEAVSRESGMSRASAFLAGSGLGVSAVGGVMLYFDFRPDAPMLTWPSTPEHSARLPQ